MIEAVLFDLDGTLTDSKEGIINCIKYALSSLGIEESDDKKLEFFIGPPLREAMRDMYNLSESNADFALNKYRERFGVKGLYENRVYDGIEDVFKILWEKDIKICLATSKPQVYAEKILEYFNLKKYFSIIVGSEFDGRRTDKTEVISCVLQKLESPKNAIMVGDRKFDVLSAHECGIPCIGAAFGFSEENELENARADYIVKTPLELKQTLQKII